MRVLLTISRAGSFILSLLILIEIFAFFYIGPIRDETVVRNKPLFKNHSKLSIVNIPNNTVQESRKVGDIYDYKDIIYSFDSFGRRVEKENQPSREDIPKILIFGSSVTFGKGIMWENTLSAHLQSTFPDHDILDYSVIGWATQHYYERLRIGFTHNEINGPVAKILFFISVNKRTGHVQRLLGTPDLCSPCHWLNHMPKLHKSSQGYVNKGTFADVYPVYYFFLRQLEKLYLSRLLNLFKYTPTQNDYNLYVSFLSDIHKLAKSKFPESNIIFVNHPVSDKYSSTYLNNATNLSQIQLLDFQSLLKREDRKNYFFGQQWPHPTGHLNKLIAESILNYLEK